MAILYRVLHEYYSGKVYNGYEKSAIKHIFKNDLYI